MHTPELPESKMRERLLKEGWKEVHPGWWKHSNAKEFAMGTYSTRAAHGAQTSLEKEKVRV